MTVVTNPVIITKVVMVVFIVLQGDFREGTNATGTAESRVPSAMQQQQQQ